MSRTMAVVAALCSLAGPARAATVFVTVNTTSASYSPQIVFIQPGDTVTWTYAGGGMAHNVRADDNSYFNTLSSAPWTPADIAYTLDAWDFSPRTSAQTTGSPSAPDFHRNGPTTELIAGVRLPAGASITGLEVAGCDTGIDAINANLFQCLDPDASCAILASVNSTGAPGCGYFAVGLTGVPNVDNLANTYLVRVALGANQTLRSVRVFYRKTVSPPPATPTFTDMPASDPRFRFVEALARAGITGGCGPGLYCPDDPITRGQMAVFLSVALGLYWPN